MSRHNLLLQPTRGSARLSATFAAQRRDLKCVAVIGDAAKVDQV
jgi:hypothetical protein